MDRKGGLLALFLRLKVEDEAEREWEKKRSCRRLGEMHEDVHDVEDGRKRVEDSPLGGRRVATTGPALSLGMGDGTTALPYWLRRPLARTDTEDGRCVATTQHAGEQALAARRARMRSGW